MQGGEGEGGWRGGQVEGGEGEGTVEALEQSCLTASFTSFELYIVSYSFVLPPTVL